MNKLVSIFVFSTVFISSTIFAIGEVARGQAKSVTCIACHGVDGNSVVESFPKLAGQNKGYLLKQLKDFKSGARIDAVMAGVVAPLTNEDMADLSAYYSVQILSQNTAKPGDNIALGERIYRGGKRQTGVTACIACHGPQGRGIPSAGFPMLSAQHVAYVVKQLKDFRQHSINTQIGDTQPSRTNDFEGIMINFTKSLTNMEIDAVAQYIASLY